VHPCPSVVFAGFFSQSSGVWPRLIASFSSPRVALSGHRHDGGIDDLTTASDVPLRTEMLVEAIKQLLDQAGLGELLAEQP
jgi:hypothetical protein